jgi:hypothetical protein
MIFVDVEKIKVNDLLILIFIKSKLDDMIILNIKTKKIINWSLFLI